MNVCSPKKFSAILLAAFSATVLSACALNNKPAEEPKPKTEVPGFAVATAHPLATQAGIEILQRGGNAFDAAVAVSATLAVVEPYGSGLGGGGFWLLHDAEKKQDIVIDGRERAPFAARERMFIGRDGKPTRDSVDGPKAAGIPGVPAALEYISTHYGRLDFGHNLQHAIHHAREGFAVSEHYVKMATMRKDALLKSSAATEIFLDEGEVPEVGFVLKQPDLANVLSTFVYVGSEDFYRGELAEKLVKGVRRSGGIWKQKDLDKYEIVVRRPIIGRYQDAELVMVPPPSSGGIVISQILNMLETVDLQSMTEVDRMHTISEAMRRAYRDRAVYLGDSDYVSIPKNKLLSKQYARNLMADFSLKHASQNENLLPTDMPTKGEDTTHFSILDADGNYVAATLSINYPFGSGFVAPGTGILLNDEMDDFAVAPGVPNVWGLVGSEANKIEPGKRMLSSMSPTFIRKGDRLMIVGTPGGSRIISMVTLATLEFMQGANAQEVVAERRFHHQYLPDEIQVEKDLFKALERNQLRARGHQVNKLGRQYGDMQAIIYNRSLRQIEAASDPRREGSAEVVLNE